MVKSVIRLIGSLLSFGFLAAVSAPNAYVRGDNVMLVGASRVTITPTQAFLEGEHGVWVAGFGAGKRAHGVYSELYARACVITIADRTVVLTALDLVGLFRDRACEIEERVRRDLGLSGEDVHFVIASTHTHAGPDTIGLWRRDLGSLWCEKARTSGVDPDYMEYVVSRTALAIEGAFGALRPARAAFGRNLAAGVISDTRGPVVMDEEVAVCRFIGEDGKTIATLLNFACHPESLGAENVLLSADFPGRTCEVLEEELGGVAVYFSGALGGQQGPDTSYPKLDEDGYPILGPGRVYAQTEKHWDDSPDAPPERRADFARMREIGEYVARKALVALRTARPVEITELRFAKEVIRIPLENPILRLAFERGVIERAPTEDGSIETEVNVIFLGDVAGIITVPGELFPESGFVLKDAMDAEYKFLIGLANDELGYLVPVINPLTGYKDYCGPTPDFQEGKPGHYEETMCIGSAAERLVVDAGLRLLRRLSPRNAKGFEAGNGPIVGGRVGGR